MGYVRRLLSENQTNEAVVRRYEVETPSWHYQAWDVDVRFPKLVILELRLSKECADYFVGVPLSLAETIWEKGLRSYCPTPWCCVWEYPVLSYRREPRVEVVGELGGPRGVHCRPVVLAVTLGPEGASE